MVRIYYLSFILLLFSSVLNAQTSLYGIITDATTGEELIGANIVAYKNGVFVNGASTDIEGKYLIDIDSGIYDLEISFIGFPTKKIQEVIVKADTNNRLCVSMINYDDLIPDCCCIIQYRIPLITIDDTTTGESKCAQDIEKMPTKNIHEISALTAGVSLH